MTRRRSRLHFQPVEPALVIDRALVESPELSQQRNQLLHAAGRMFAVEPMPVLLHAPGAGSEPESQAPTRDLIQVAGLGRQYQRRAAERVGDRASELDPGGRLHHRGQTDHGRAVVELRRPYRGEADLLAPAGGIGELGRSPGAGHKRDSARAHRSRMVCSRPCLGLQSMRRDPYTAPDFASSALITIDTQRDVLDGQPLEIPGTSAALPAMQRLLDGFREAGRPIVHIVRLYRRDGSNADLCRRRLIEEGTAILAPGSEGSELAPGLLSDPAARLDPDQLLSWRGPRGRASRGRHLQAALGCLL